MYEEVKFVIPQRLKPCITNYRYRKYGMNKSAVTNS